MREGGPKAFWLSLVLTLSVLLPLMAVVVFWGAWQNRGAAPADREQSGIPVRSPGGQHSFNVLAVVAEDPAAFVLLRLDAGKNRIAVTALPGETVLNSPAGPVLLAQSYREAGPARAVQCLEATLGIRIRHYVAITAEKLGQAFAPLGTARVNLTSLLTEAERSVAGFGGPVQEFTPASAVEFLASVPMEPPRRAALRGAVWEAFVRQNLEQLPREVPDGLRLVSSSLLTSLTAVDLYTLADTLEFLADWEGITEAARLPGRWDGASQRYELQPDAPAWAAQKFGGAVAQVQPPAVLATPTASPKPSPTPQPPAMAGGLQ